MIQPYALNPDIEVLRALRIKLYSPGKTRPVWEQIRWHEAVDHARVYTNIILVDLEHWTN